MDLQAQAKTLDEEPSSSETNTPSSSQFDDGLNLDLMLRKREGNLVPFQGRRILLAIEKAFKAHKDIPLDGKLDPFCAREANIIAKDVVSRIAKTKRSNDDVVAIEEVQDIVEILLMQQGHYAVARGYIVYREERARARSLESAMEKA